MKVVNAVVKVFVALATIAGAIYVAATYGEQIVAWAKQALAKIQGVCDSLCPAPAEEAPAEECECSEGECECTESECECACEETECACEEAPAEEEAPVEEEAPAAEPVAAEEDFEA